MAQKHDSHAAAHPSAPPAHASPPVTPSDTLLSSLITLPSNSRIAYVTFVPAADGPPYDLLEFGRRQLVSQNDSLPLLESTLPHTHIDGTSSALHVFMFTSQDHSDACLSTLSAISLDGLVVLDISLFDPQALYPCSFECAAQPSPCHLCRDPKRSSTSNPDFSAANLLPRKPLRIIYSRFINALRSRIIDDITKVSKDAIGGRSAHRLMDGFLLTSSPISNEWATDWLSVARLRPLVHCRLGVHLSASRLEVYSHFRPTDLLPLDLSLPVAAGTPITLLPFGVPSYYLSTYNGPASGITSQFEQSLTGLGAGEWKSSLVTSHSERQTTVRLGIPKRTSPIYVIAWIAVQNKQGEDKGIAIIWPLQLCLAFTASSQSAHARRPLPYLPDLPSQLQPSPPPPPPPSVALTLSSSEEASTLAVPTPSILSGRPMTRRPCASPASESVRAFRCLTLSNTSKVESVASEIGLYVESVAKERERERERIRRERENAQSSASPRPVATPSTSTSVPTSASVTITGNSPVALSPNNGSHAAGETQIIIDPVQTQIVVTSGANLPQPYPSPPSAHGKANPQPITSSVESAAAPEPSLVSQTESAPPPLDPRFDPFGSMDATWTQPSNDFMSLGEVYDMGFDMNVDNIGAGSGGGTTSTGHANMDFEDGFIFTEDDFDFFDRPSGAARATRPIASSLEESSSLPFTGSAPMGFLPSILGDGTFPVATAFTPGQQQSSPFTTGGTADPFTPRFSELYHMQDLVPTGTDMTLPSPGPTLNSEPTTPQVKLSLEHKKGPAVLSNFFDPIPFAQNHILSDSKYHMGKFALPSPPDEEDRTQPIPHLSSPTQNNHWKDRYNAATDPRIGLVRKLIGVKRKSFEQGSRTTRLRPSWLQYSLDLEYSMSDDADDNSAIASDDEDLDGAEPAIPSRTTTPPPAYLPHGPTLLHMQFSHPYLLPLSRPLRPPDAAVAPMTIPAPVPTSVPTPVSPAAALGATSEKSKSLEAAGGMVAREVVENNIFADAWRASNTHCSPHRQLDVWPTDVSTLTQIIHGLPALEGPVELQAFLNHEAGAPPDHALLQRMDMPMISVGKGDSIIQVLPASLRFWEKLGLTPRAGKKDLTAFLFFEDNGLDKQLLAETWLRKLSSTYSARQLGTHIPGSHSLCSVDGIFALRLDSLRKHLSMQFALILNVFTDCHTLASFAADLPPELAGLVFYIAIPDSALTLASPLLRQISSTMKRLQKVRPGHPITLQLIPEHHITSHDLGTTDFERLCFSVYRRVPQLVDRTMSRRIFDIGKEIRGFFREPAYTLARPLKPAVRFNLGPARTLDVLDRHTFLHVGYTFSACGKWLLAACIDQRGESYDLGSWLTRDEVEASAIVQVWNFALQTARRTNIEWRLVISKLGLMSPTELDAWVHHLSAVLSLYRDLAPFHVTILSVDQSISWSLKHPCQPSTGQQTPSRRAAGKDSSSKSLYVDVTTATTYAVYPATRIPLSSPPAYPWLDCSFVPDDEGAASTETTCPILPVRSTILLYVPFKRAGPSCSTLHIHFLHSCKSPGSSLLIPDDVTYQEITRNYYELAVLASLQGPFGYPILPLHLSALESMQDALRQETE
ncbi:mediator complex subunit 13 C-terminal-domain-containing protein [Lanmaoa asiatica]|nr:mediator complex subunit 13 C-terminal-domain-containing protein [Lanmaoa asiatica]